jgi:hypothetical protein
MWAKADIALHYLANFLSSVLLGKLSRLVSLNWQRELKDRASRQIGRHP